MKYVDEFKDRKIVEKIAEKIGRLNIPANLMEVCGTHTMAIFKYGIRSLLPEDVKLLSGPGCPVCVTGEADIDAMIRLADVPGAVIATFGDMMRVPGSKASLSQKKAEGADIRVVYSPLDALALAREVKPKPVIFLGVGFETTAPTVAAVIVEAHEKGIYNFYVYSAHKLIPPALDALLHSGEVRVDGFLLPGHVSTIIGLAPYEFILKEFGIPSVVAGFEPVDIMESIYMLLTDIHDIRNLPGRHPGLRANVEIEYSRAVKYDGNVKAQGVMNEVFEPADASWRGFGRIAMSGLEIRKKYSRHDAKKIFGVQPLTSFPTKSACRCGDVLRGFITPPDCKLFSRVCTPDNPKGPCMVSTEGACAAYFKYRGLRTEGRGRKTEGGGRKKT